MLIFVGVFRDMDVNWRLSSVHVTGTPFAKKLAKCLWYLDAHHGKFTSRGIRFPSRFAQFQGYNDYKRKKEKEPRLSSEELKHHIDELSGMLLQPWFSGTKFNSLRSDVEELVESMKKYMEYLTTQTDRIKAHQSSTDPTPQEDKASLTTLPATIEPIPPAYNEVAKKLEEESLYSPVYLNELAPRDRYLRRKWVSNIKLPMKVMLYKFMYGNHLGTLLFCWKVPDVVDESKVGRIFSELTRKTNTYSTRAVRGDFLNKYHGIAKIPKMILRNIYRTLVQDCSAETTVDSRVAKAILDFDDADIVLDLRKTNGRPNSGAFEQFWQELDAYFNELTLCVDDRRHGDVLHMPIAVSIRDLRETIIKKLEEKHPESVPAVPSCEWLRLQMWPSNTYSHQAIKYTGRFKVKYAVQIRQQRKDHPDIHYVNALQLYTKHFAVKYSDCTAYVSVDDKAIIPVGEPDCHVSTGVRGHNRSLVPLEGPQVQALDHDFHVQGIVPSVSFFINIPENPTESFYRGQAFVTNKDKATRPSSPLRHAAELSDLVRIHYSENGSTATKPIMVVISDGGPDHRVTFGSVQVASLTLFMSLNLDMLVCMRTCPYQSWRNVAERVMSTLNLALQNVSLARASMPHRFEQQLKNKNTLCDVRQAIKDIPDLGDALRDSMSVPMKTVGERFQRMEIKEKPIKLGVPASDSQMTEQFKHVLEIDPSLSEEHLTKKDLDKATSLKNFMKAHCHVSAYMFQVKKCSEPSCTYCIKHPIQLEPDRFSQLNFVPLPLLDSSGDHYQSFSDLYGKPLSNKDRPSRVATPTDEQVALDRERKSLLVAGKVRMTISCDECKKPRCIYAQSVLTGDQRKMLEDIKDSRVYTCGSDLFPNNTHCDQAIVVRQALVCNTPMESQYYSAILVKFPRVCYHCGLGEESLVENDYIQDLQKCYAVVLPICFLCLDDGKKPHCKKPNNLAKRQKLS